MTFSLRAPLPMGAGEAVAAAAGPGTGELDRVSMGDITYIRTWLGMQGGIKRTSQQLLPREVTLALPARQPVRSSREAFSAGCSARLGRRRGHAKVRALGEVLTEQAVDVLVCAALPG